ncbi:MAG TPA: guanylate kinase [Symbiobacteriaceae bacterium]|nr:guanylate kinase [Symbiobacteriaceae bacterium]
MPIKAKGLLVVVTGPSAVGKGTICRALLQEAPDVRFSVSCTTRAARPGEVHGVEYFFHTREEFQTKVDRGELLEWAEVYGNYYGTPRHYVEEVTDAGQDIILDIDMVGARAVRERYPGAVSVFVIPPSMETLRARIIGRGTESEEAVQRRLQEAPKWIEEGLGYDYVIVNDDLPSAVRQLRSILEAEKSRMIRRGSMLIRRLLEKGELD